MGFPNVVQAAVNQECEMQRCLALLCLVIALWGWLLIPDCSAQKIKPPKQAVVLRTTRTIKKLYQSDFKIARSKKQQSQLAARLLQDARETKGDDAGRYVLLLLARNLAIKACDAGQIDRVVETTSQFYVVDRFQTAATSLSKATRGIREPEELINVANVALRLARTAGLADRYKQAKRLVGVAVSAGRRAKSRAISKSGSQLRRKLDAAEREFGLVKAARIKLKKSPQDKPANTVVGRYLCLTQQKWREGLPFLSMGKDKLAAVARLELLKPKDVKDRVKLADLWWEAANRAPKRAVGPIQRHAAGIYQTTVAGLTGLARARVTRRIQAAPKESAVSLKVPAKTRLRISLGNRQVLTFRRIEPGRFVMGSAPNEPNRGLGERAHIVTLTKPYYIATTELTQAQWLAITGRPRKFRFVGATRPADSVTWQEAQSLLVSLNKSKRGTNYRFRLPTEAEWEYACRASSAAAYSFGSPLAANQHAWHQGNSMRQTRPVGSLKPNAWGLYDMNGNVWEWCSDWAGPYVAAPQTDPMGPRTGNAHRIRGGSFVSEIHKLRAAHRAQLEAGIRNSTIGLRLVCERR